MWQLRAKCRIKSGGGEKEITKKGDKCVGMNQLMTGRAVYTLPRQEEED